jgi:hypothetical protein
VKSAGDAERRVTHEIAEQRPCGAAAQGDVKCEPRRGGWQCDFGVTQDGFVGSAFVPSDGGDIDFTTIC